MAQMRAVLIRDGQGPVDKLYIGNAPKPNPGPEQVLVKVKAFGLNRMDIAQREGKYPPPKGSSEILGVEFSGTIVELGTGVSDWAVNEDVLGLAGGGAYAEFIVVSSKLIMKKPPHLSWVESASIPEAFLTAFQALVFIGEVKPHENVLVHAGASGVGIATIQLARLYGADTVTTTSSKNDKLEWLKSMPNGATDAINYVEQDFADATKAITQGRGVDLIVDLVGQSHFVQNLQALGFDGRVVLLSTVSGRSVSNLDIGLILFKRLRIQGSTLRSRSLEYQSELFTSFSSKALDKITGVNGSGPLKTYIHKVFPWTEIQEAHRELESNKNIGKIVAEVV